MEGEIHRKKPIKFSWKNVEKLNRIDFFKKSKVDRVTVLVVFCDMSSAGSVLFDKMCVFKCKSVRFEKMLSPWPPQTFFLILSRDFSVKVDF